jgi:cell wall-associated NlpC family hydrolase
MNTVLLLGCAAALVATPVVVLVLLSGGSTAAQAASCGQPGTQTTLGPLTADQIANATVIVDVGEQMVVPAYGQVIAVATALQESGLHDLNYGDADSLGLFQQRPSQGWGAPTQIVDPRDAATAFYDHLLAVPGWEAMTLTQAAQTVQRSAFPDAYAKWQDEAVGIVQQFAGGTPVIGSSVPASDLGAGLSSPGSPASDRAVSAASVASAACAPQNLAPRSVGQLLAFAAEQVGKPYMLGATGPGAWDCSGLVQAAYAAADVSVPRSADEQYDFARAHGQILVGPPTAADLQPGDLLFSPGDDPVPAADGNPIGHVAIYAGNGVVIEAKGAGWGVISTSYTTGEFGSVTFVGRLVAQPGAQQAPPPTAGIFSSPAPASPPGSAKPSPKGST